MPQHVPLRYRRTLSGRLTWTVYDTIGRNIVMHASGPRKGFPLVFPSHPKVEEACDRMNYKEAIITSVWSSFGHRFYLEDIVERGTNEPPTGETYEKCMTCGAQFIQYHDDPEDPSHGAYRANSGDEPTYCKGGSICHGEEPCTIESCAGALNGEPCEHTEHDCNCLLCVY